MSKRLQQTALSLVAVVGAFFAYRVVAVPFIEPSAVVRETKATSAELNSALGADTRNAELLNRIFPPGAWQRNDPIVLESDQALLLMKEYRNLDTGEVELNPFTMVFFPNGDQSLDETLLRRVIVLQAPQGAILKFDEPFDLRKAKIGKLVGGHMPGLITIRGNPGGYHGEDEIYAETRDLELTTTRVHTTERVTFRIGPNHGHGRELQMKLTQNPQTTKRGPNIGGVESIELLHDVFMHLAAGNSGLLPGDHPNANHPSEHRLASVPPASGLTPIADNNGHLPGHAQVLAAGNPAALVPIVPRAQTIRSVPPTNQSPVEITCQGPFKYNLLETLATFQDQVNIVRPQPNGPADQGECEVLNVKFAPKPAPAEATAALDEGSATATVAALASEKSAAGEKSATTAEPAAPRHGSSNLEPRSIELLGNPAILRAPSSESFAQGQRMEYEISSGRITVEDQKEVALRQAGNEIHAQRLVYQPAEPGRLGRLVAIGPGWLKGKTPTTPNLPNGAASANAGGQIWEARWKNELRIRPNEGQQVISLLGEGQLRYGQIGFLQGNEIYFWLNEIPLTANALALPVATHDADRPLAPPATPDAFGAASGAATVAGAPRPHASADAAKTPIQLLPDKMLCRGTVLIDSPQVSGATDRLEMWFKPALPSGLSVTGGAAARGAVQPVSLEADARPPGASATAATGSASIAPLPTARFSNVPNPNLPSNLTGGNLHGEGSRPANGALSRAALNSSAPGANPGNLPANTQHFEVHGKLIRIQSLLAGQRMALDDVTIEGDARLDETQTALPSDRPMHLDGDQLQILGAAGPKTIAKVKGRPAHTEARGLGLTGELIQLDRGANRLWIDGPGRMTLPMDRGFDGRPLANPRPLAVDWQGRMSFDGVTAHFETAIEAHNELQSLKTAVLDVTMLKRIDFAQPTAQERPAVQMLACQGGMLLESRAFDGQRVVAWDRMRTKDLAVNQITGDMLAHGPGWFTSLRYGAAANPLNPVQPGAPPPAAAATKTELQYLNVQFLKEITGNLNQREMTFHDQVHTVYGPVKDWADELNADRLEGLGPRGVLMTSQSMKIAEMPAPPPNRGSLEIDARENVMIEAQSFTARAARVSYAQAKDLIVLEGDSRTDAQLFRQQAVGGPTAKAAAKKILFWRGTNRVELDDARFLDLGQLGGGTLGTNPLGGPRPPAAPASTKPRLP